MTSYNIITDAETDPSAPLTSELAKKWRDNPIAMSEGATSAPFVAAGWHPYNGTVVGGANDGKIYDFATDGVVAIIETPTFVDGYEYLLFLDQIDTGLAGTSAGSISVGLYRETTAAYVTVGAINVNTVNVGGYLKVRDLQAQIHIKRPRDTANVCLLDIQSYCGALATTASVTADPYGYATSHTTAQKIGKVRLSAGSVNFEGGKVFLYRRRVF